MEIFKSPRGNSRWKTRSFKEVIMTDEVIHEAVEIRILSVLSQNERLVYFMNLIMERPYINTAEILGCSSAYVHKLKESVTKKIQNAANL